MGKQDYQDEAKGFFEPSANVDTDASLELLEDSNLTTTAIEELTDSNVHTKALEFSNEKGINSTF